MTLLKVLPRLSRRSHYLHKRLHVQRRFIQSDSAVFRVSEEVRQAVAEKKPVVSLETTIYTHGFPFPENLRLAERLDSLVRETGGIPAHCAVLDGVARVGLDHDEVQRLVENGKARKVSRRDLGPLLGSAFTGSKLNGGTTIAGTMILSHLAGIKVFATGGLGGVHRGVEETMDISADLTEFARTPVAVVSAGCKGFLDIPRTLEYLETQGAFVGTFADGREGSVRFPAFWARESLVQSPFTVKDEKEAAAMIHAQSMLGLTSGLLFANPVPEAHGIEPKEMNAIIEAALIDAKEITGAANTPFVLNRIKELSRGKSVTANTALIEANLIRGTQVAVELSMLERGANSSSVRSGGSPATSSKQSLATIARGDSEEDSAQEAELPPDNPQSHADIAVIGSIALDLACDYTPLPGSPDKTSPNLHTSNPASIQHNLGGVGYNVAKAARFAGGSAVLCSVLGNDAAAEAVHSALADDEDFQGQMLAINHKTAQYVAVNDVKKNLVMGMADMGIFERVTDKVSEEELSQWLSISQPKWLVADANWNAEFLTTVLQEARGKGTKTAFEPVSTAKSVRLLQSLQHGRRLVFPQPLVDLATPNKLELTAMYTAAKEAGFFERADWWQVIDSLGISSGGARVELALATSSSLVDEGIPQQTIQLLPFISCILTKLGAEGVLMTELLAADDARLSSPEAAPYILSRSKTGGEGVGGVYMRLFAPEAKLEDIRIVSTNGAGDTFLGVLVAALTRKDGIEIQDVVQIAQKAAWLTLQSPESVSQEVKGLRSALDRLKGSEPSR